MYTIQATIKCPVHPDTLAKVAAGLLIKRINIEAESLKVMTSKVSLASIYDYAVA